jgi:hypothetical protein
MALGAPGGAMLHDPVEQRFLEADIVAGFLALDPFVAEDLFALSEEFFVKERFFHEVEGIIGTSGHALESLTFIIRRVNSVA